MLAWAPSELDVQCERCKTEYEFDDALVSGRGTTVRCTHCGHQFKVRRGEATDGAGDRWLVQTIAGQQLTFLTLRELQRAILAKQVGRDDTLLLGGGPARLLGSIAELEPFFDGRTTSRPAPAPDGPAPEGNNYSAPPPDPVHRTQPFGTKPAYVSSSPPTFAEAPKARARFDQVPTPSVAISPSAPVPANRPASGFPPPTVPTRRAIPVVDDELHDMHDMHAPFPPSSDDPYDLPRRRRVGGWVVAFVLLLAVGVVGWVLAKPYLIARSVPAAPRLDARAQAFLSDGERAMADGDLRAAQQAFDKASALAEHDPRVLLDGARVAAATADVWWLKLRLLPPDSVDDVRATRAQLDESLARARKASDDAMALSPDDPAAVRAKIDVLRLQGARDAARAYIPKLSPLAAQSDTAYVLAALDLAEPEPFWNTVIDRLRSAASAENGSARARAALVYALAKSGDVASAKSELAKLEAMPRPYPLLPTLHAFVEKTPLKSTVDAGTVTTAPRVDVSAQPTVVPAPSAAAGAAAAVEHQHESVSGDQSGGMHAATAAIKRGEWAHAREIYEALVARNPSDSEAMAGIGDVDRAQGDSAGAIAAYKRALAINPSYLPALLGVADTQWASGDRTSARRSYKDIVDRFPEGTYPAYVSGRVEPAEPPASAAPGSGSGKASDPANGI